MTAHANYSYTGNATLDAIAAEAGAATLDEAVEWYVLLGIEVIFVVMRTWARISLSTVRGLGWDDFIVWLGLLCSAIQVTTSYFLTVPYVGIANDAISDERRAALWHDSGSQEYRMRVVGSKLQLLCWISYASALWCLKGALLVFFVSRLSLDLQAQRGRILFGTILIPGTWLALVLITFLSCRPLHYMWQIYPDPGVLCHASDSPLFVWSYFVCNICTDLYLLSIPVPILMRVSLTTKQKLGLLCLFGCTILITLIAIVRVILINTSGSVNADGIWALREIFVATVTSCLAPAMPILRKIWLKLFGGSETIQVNDSPPSFRKSPRIWNLGRLTITITENGTVRTTRRNLDSDNLVDHLHLPAAAVVAGESSFEITPVEDGKRKDWRHDPEKQRHSVPEDSLYMQSKIAEEKW